MTTKKTVGAYGFKESETQLKSETHRASHSSVVFQIL